MAARHLGDPDRVTSRSGSRCGGARLALPRPHRPDVLIVGVTLAVKFFLWPLLVWLVGDAEIGTAALAAATGAVVLVLSWAAIGFAGFLDYPDLLRRLDDTVGDDAYTVTMLALDLGAPELVAR